MFTISTYTKSVNGTPYVHSYDMTDLIHATKRYEREVGFMRSIKEANALIYGLVSINFTDDYGRTATLQFMEF